jgi:hypothetical protein
MNTMRLFLTNSLGGQKELFTSLKPDHVLLYCCGITPYDYSHIGHGRSYVSVDLLARLLKFLGYSVKYVRNFTDLDFLKYSFPEAQAAASAKGDTLAIWEAVKKLGGTPVNNYLYRNNGSLQLEDVTKAWGLDEGLVSTGAAWADLDGDGDLELITNNTNDSAHKIKFVLKKIFYTIDTKISLLL